MLEKMISYKYIPWGNYIIMESEWLLLQDSCFFCDQILSSVVRPARAVGGGILQSINGGYRPFGSIRHLSQQVVQPKENAAISIVPAPLTVLSEEEEMMKEAGNSRYYH